MEREKLVGPTMSVHLIKNFTALVFDQNQFSNQKLQDVGQKDAKVKSNESSLNYKNL